jgi:hypothetical protein
VESAEAGRYKRTIEALQAQLAAAGIAPTATYSALTVATSTAASGRCVEMYSLSIHIMYTVSLMRSQQ